MCINILIYTYWHKYCENLSTTIRNQWSQTYVSRRISRRTARSTVIQPRGGAWWSGRTISSCSPSRHHYWSLLDSRSSPRRISPTACLELSATRETRLFPAQLSSRISLSLSRRERPAVIRAKESARAPPPPPRTCPARDSASTMHRYAKKLRFRRDEIEHQLLVRVAHFFVHHLLEFPPWSVNRHFTGWTTEESTRDAPRNLQFARKLRVRKSNRPPDAIYY